MNGYIGLEGVEPVKTMLIYKHETYPNTMFRTSGSNNLNEEKTRNRNSACSIHMPRP
jgi:hypothetical protein